MLITLPPRMESFYMILLLIVCINGELRPSSESNVPENVKTHYIPTAVSYVSFVRHIVPQRVKHSMVVPQLSTRAPMNHHSFTKQPTKTILNQHFSYGKKEVQRDRSMSHHKTAMQPTANTYRPIYPTGYGEPIYVHSKIPLPSRHVSGNREGNNPMVIGVQQPAYVKKYLQVGAYHPSWVRKTLTYAPKLNYIPHNYQRV
uniref:Uncharacterized protein n=1 Tax=Anopheles funestus TaxID=62324 RepID=A0A182S412_ANOFN